MPNTTALFDEASLAIDKPDHVFDTSKYKARVTAMERMAWRSGETTPK